MEIQDKNGLNNVQGEIVSNDEFKKESVLSNPQNIINEQLKIKIKTLELQIKELERERQDYLDEKEKWAEWWEDKDNECKAYAYENAHLKEELDGCMRWGDPRQMRYQLSALEKNFNACSDEVFYARVKEVVQKTKDRRMAYIRNKESEDNGIKDWCYENLTRDELIGRLNDQDKVIAVLMVGNDTQKTIEEQARNWREHKNIMADRENEKDKLVPRELSREETLNGWKCQKNDMNNMKMQPSPSIADELPTPIAY